ncbi:MAG: glycosyl transferase [Bacteroidaceae bacterium]|nr:glycosyl transferase [Bacteroidaceae bacterium]
MLNKIIKAFKNPYWAFGVVLRRCFSRWMDDETFIKWEYFSGMGKFPNIEHPRTYNDKLQWLKLHDVHEEYVQLVDKCEAKKYVAELIGEEYIIPTLDVWDSFEEIDFNTLPDQFVIKTTHDSGGVVVCRDKKTFDIEKARKKINKSLRHNYFFEHREYPYKGIKPRVIVEKYMVDESGTELKDYKFFCFDGKCRMLFVATDRNIDDVRFDFFDENFNHLPFKQGHPLASKPIHKPVGFEEMRSLAERLSQGFRHVRVDLYDINGRIYFGELTFFHFSGNVPFEPEEWDYKIGEWLKLPTE